eukprot:1421871-Prymnesium_polylepis.1
MNSGNEPVLSVGQYFQPGRGAPQQAEHHVRVWDHPPQLRRFGGGGLAACATCCVLGEPLPPHSLIYLHNARISAPLRPAT